MDHVGEIRTTRELKNHYALQGRREGGGGAGGAKYLGPGLVRGGRNLDKTSGHCATVKRVGGP